MQLAAEMLPVYCPHPGLGIIGDITRICSNSGSEVKLYLRSVRGHFLTFDLLSAKSLFKNKYGCEKKSRRKTYQRKYPAVCFHRALHIPMHCKTMDLNIWDFSWWIRKHCLKPFLKPYISYIKLDGTNLSRFLWFNFHFVQWCFNQMFKSAESFQYLTSHLWPKSFSDQQTRIPSFSNRCLDSSITITHIVVPINMFSCLSLKHSF